MVEQQPSKWARMSGAVERVGRRKVRAGAGLLLAAALAIPSGIALADGVTKSDPPAPVAVKSEPPSPDAAEGTPSSSPSPSDDAAGSAQGAAGDLDESALSDPPGEETAPLDDALQDPAGTIESGDDAKPTADQATAEGRVDPKTQAEIAAEPATSSAKEISKPGESLTTIDEAGLEQKGAAAKAIADGAKDTSTAKGKIAVAGTAGEAKADYVIVGLSAPLDTAGADVHVIGASWDKLAKGVDVKAELREEINGTWGAWRGLELADGDSNDSGVNAKRQSTEPYVSVAASDLQVRLLTSDGSSPKNASVDLIGDDVSNKDKKAASAGTNARLNVTQTASNATLGETAAVTPALLATANDSGGIVSADTGEMTDATPTDQADGTDETAETDESAETDEADVATVAAKSVPKPTIKSRSAWGAKKPKDPYDVGAVKGMVIHHTAGSNNYSKAQVPAILRSIQQYHMRTLGWNDIGYNFLIDKYGTIWEGRAGGVTRAVAGAQALHMNYTTSGVSVLGTYSSAPPSSAALNALGKLVAWKLNYHGVNPWGTMVNRGKRTSTIIGHRDAPGNSTSCPGNAFYAKLGSLRSWVRDHTAANFVFSGKGSGHAVGLSLYGARQMAAQGKSASSILRYYYPGAQVTRKAKNPLLKVQIVKTARATTVKRSAGQMRLVAGSKRYVTNAVTFFMRGNTMYAKVNGRTVRSGSAGFQVQWTGTRYWGGKAGIVKVDRASKNTSPLRYRYGRLLVTRIDRQINIVNQVLLNNEYLYGVSLVPSTWPRKAMQAAAVVARTYTLRLHYDIKGATKSDCNCHLTDESALLYRGWTKAGQAKYGELWRSAVDGTGRNIVTSRTYVARLAFSGSSGGSTLSRTEAFGSAPLPYLASRPDPYSLTAANPYRSWRVQVSPTQVAARLKLPNVVELKVVGKTPRGGVTAIEARSADGTSKVISGTTEKIRSMLGLRSAFFTVARSS